MCSFRRSLAASAGLTPLVGALAACLALTITAQEAPPAARYSEEGRMLAVHRLLAGKQRLNCEKVTRTGVVAKVGFDIKRRVVSFTIPSRRPRAANFALPYPESLDPADLEKLPTLVKMGARLKVTAYSCGAAAAALEADAIEALPDP